MIESGVYFDGSCSEYRPYCVDIDYSKAFAVMPTTAGVYAISGNREIREDGVLYIGSSYGRKGMFGRVSKHFREIRNDKHSNTRLQRSILKYGEGSFSLFVLELCQPEDAREREQNWIDFYLDRHPNALFNFETKVGKSTLGRKLSPETKEKLRQAKLGRKFSAKHRENCRKAKIGTKLSRETKLKIGLKHSKPIRVQHRITGQIHVANSIREFAQKFAIKESNLSALLLGKRRSAGNFIMPTKVNVKN